MDNKSRLKEIISILKESNILSDHSPFNVRMTIEKLGPTFIKIGQIFSTRVDLIPMEYCDEFAKLRSEVTPLPYSEIEAILYKTYPNINEIFANIDTIPVGSASIAQVHKAKLKTGENVVIKVKRPNIDEQLRVDIELMKQAINTLHINHFITVVDLSSALDEVYNVTKEELDFTKEVEHALTFYNKNKDNKNISIPLIYTSYTTPNTIVMEDISGIKIDDIPKLQEKYDLKTLAAIISDNYIKQAIDDGLFHADPHPDNIVVSGNKIYLLDWGMTGCLKQKNRDLLRECMKAIIVEDYYKVAEILVSMSKKTKEVSMDTLTYDIKNILMNVGDASLDDIDTKQFITDMFKMLQRNGLVLDHDVTMLVRGILTLEGVLAKLDSSISLLTVLSKHVLSNEINYLDTRETLQKVGKKLYQNGKSMVNLPSEVESLVRSIKDGNFKFKFEMSDSTKHIDKLESLVHEIVLGFIDGCLIVGYSTVEGNIAKKAFGICILIVSLILVLKMLTDIKHKGY